MISMQTSPTGPSSRRSFLKAGLCTAVGLGTATGGITYTLLPKSTTTSLTSYSSNNTINSTWRWLMDEKADLAKKIFPDLPFPLKSWFDYYDVGLDYRYTGSKSLARVQSEMRAEAPEIETAEKKKLLDLDPVKDILPIFDRSSFPRHFASKIKSKGQIDSSLSFLRDEESPPFRFNKLFTGAASKRLEKAKFFDDDELMKLWTYIRIRSEYNATNNKSSQVENSLSDKESLRTKILAFLCPNMELSDIKWTIDVYDGQRLQELKKIAEKDEVRARYLKSLDSKPVDLKSIDSKSPDAKSIDSKSPHSKSLHSHPLIRSHRIRTPRIMGRSED